MAGSLERLPRAAVGTGLSLRLEEDNFRIGVDTPELCVVSPLMLKEVVALLSVDISLECRFADDVTFLASAEVPSLTRGNQHASANAYG